MLDAVHLAKIISVKQHNTNKSGCDDALTRALLNGDTMAKSTENEGSRAKDAKALGSNEVRENKTSVALADFENKVVVDFVKTQSTKSASCVMNTIGSTNSFLNRARTVGDPGPNVSTTTEIATAVTAMGTKIRFTTSPSPPLDTVLNKAISISHPSSKQSKAIAQSSRLTRTATLVNETREGKEETTASDGDEMERDIGNTNLDADSEVPNKVGGERVVATPSDKKNDHHETASSSVEQRSPTSTTLTVESSASKNQCDLDVVVSNRDTELETEPHESSEVEPQPEQPAVIGPHVFKPLAKLEVKMSKGRVSTSSTKAAPIPTAAKKKLSQTRKIKVKGISTKKLGFFSMLPKRTKGSASKDVASSAMASNSSISLVVESSTHLTLDSPKRQPKYSPKLHPIESAGEPVGGPNKESTEEPILEHIEKYSKKCASADGNSNTVALCHAFVTEYDEDSHWNGDGDGPDKNENSANDNQTVLAATSKISVATKSRASHTSTHGTTASVSLLASKTAADAECELVAARKKVSIAKAKLEQAKAKQEVACVEADAIADMEDVNRVKKELNEAKTRAQQMTASNMEKCVTFAPMNNTVGRKYAFPSESSLKVKKNKTSLSRGTDKLGSYTIVQEEQYIGNDNRGVGSCGVDNTLLDGLVEDVVLWFMGDNDDNSEFLNWFKGDNDDKNEEDTSYDASRDISCDNNM